MPGPRITTYQSMLFGLAILLAAAAVWFSIAKPPATQADFTQFWMLPSAQSKNNCAVQIGVQSDESAPITYRIVVKVNGIQVNSWSAVPLAPQGKWERSLTVKPGTAASTDVEAQLLRADKPGSVYRDVHAALRCAAAS